VSWLTAIWTWFSTLDPRIWQAIVAGLFIAIGWLVNGWQNRKQAALQAQQTRDDANALRAERLRDVHRALYAEIGANLENLSAADALEDDVAQVLAQMTDDDSYIPFLPREDRSVVFRSIVQDIHILPRTTIDAIVAYYAQVTSISSLIDDIRSDGYAALPAKRRVAIYSDLMVLKRQALEFGNYALRIIKTYAEEGSGAAKALETEVKSGFSTQQGADPSGQ